MRLSALTYRATRALAPLLALLAGPAAGVALGQSSGEVVIVKPGKVQRLAVTAPPAAVAGQPFEVLVEALDAQGNRVSEAASIEGEIRVEASGAARPDPATLAAASFVEGIARVKVKDERAESLSLLFSRSGQVLGQTREIRVLPADLDRFVVRAPSTVIAGLPARIDLEARDRYGNLVTDLGSIGRELLVTSSGGGLFEPAAVTVSDFSEGRANFSAVYRVAETVKLTVSAASVGRKGESDPIEVKPGLAHHFAIEAPTAVVCGQPFPLKLRAYDPFNNLITAYSRVGGDVVLTTSTGGAIEPRLIEVTRFEHGLATVAATVTTAGDFRVLASARGGEIANASEVLRAEPGAIASFDIEIPQTATVKAAIPVKLVARDTWGNPGASLAGAGPVQLSDDGGLLAPATVPPASFQRGIALTSIVPDKVGRTAIVASLGGTRARSVGTPLEIGPGAAARFTLEAPATVNAGEPFEVVIAVFDPWGNPVTDFDTKGGAVALASAGDGQLLLPYRVQASQFQGGRARSRPVIERAGKLRLQVAEENGKLAAQSGEIAVHTGSPDHFRVTIPPTAIAGTPFPLTIEARDRFGNRITDYERVGLDVRLDTEGSGTLTPAIVESKSFADGIATVTVSYDRAEALVIRPRFASRPGEIGGDGRLDLPPYGRDSRPVPTQAIPQREARIPPPERRAPVTAPIEREAPRIEERTPASTSAPAPPRPAPRATPPPAGEGDGEERATPGFITSPARPATATTPQLRRLGTTPTPKPTPVRAAGTGAGIAPAIARASAPPPAVPPAPATASPAGVRVRGIRFEGDTLRIASDGALEAAVTTEFRYGTQWMVITLSPVLNDLAALKPTVVPASFGGIETALGGSTATIGLELLAERIDYHIAKGPEEVAITFTRANGSR